MDHRPRYSCLLSISNKPPVVLCGCVVRLQDGPSSRLVEGELASADNIANWLKNVL